MTKCVITRGYVQGCYDQAVMTKGVMTRGGVCSRAVLSVTAFFTSGIQHEPQCPFIIEIDSKICGNLANSWGNAPAPHHPKITSGIPSI